MSDLKELIGWVMRHGYSTGHADTQEELLNELSWQVNEHQDQLVKMREALIRLRDCGWVISLPDRMDAVRKIAREALV